MKKIILSLTVLILSISTQLFAQYPIPSYNVTVSSNATFEEQQSTTITPCQVLGKRSIHIKVTCLGLSMAACSATVWVYSLDGQTILGPYTVNGGDTLTVEIDDREWGVYVETEDNISVDVWTSAQ